MATRKEILLGQVFFALGRGVGKAHLSDESVSWLVERYAKWLETTVPETKLTPIEDWEKYGEAFLQQFFKIGEAATAEATRSPGLRAEVSAAQAAVQKIEGSRTANCPYCPDDPTS